MAAMKSMIMGVMDVGHTMSHALDRSSGDNKLSIASSFFSNYVLQRMLASKTVEFGLVTYGSDETNNFLNDSQGGGYESVTEVVPMEKPDINTVKYIAGVKCGKGSGDMIDGIVVAQDVLNRTNVNKAYNRIMVVFTDGETEVEGVEDLETIVGNMKSIVNFSLYIAMIGKVTSSSSAVKKENAKLLLSLAESIGGRFAEMEQARDGSYLLAEGPGLGTKPQMLKTVFELSPQLKIPCVYWSKVSKAKVPTMKKVAVSALSSEDGEAGQVKRDTTYRNPEDPDVELTPEEKVKGYKYGPQYVPVTANEEGMFKLQSPASVTLIGSIPAASIPRYHYLEGPLFLQGAVENDAAQVSIVVLSRTLKQTGQALLARFVKRTDADPFLAALMPSDQEDQENCLLVHRLPCSEDIRDYLFPSLCALEAPSSAAQKQQAAAVSSFVDAMTLREAPRTTVCPVNPVLFNLYNVVRDKITGTISTEVNASTALRDTIRSPFHTSPAVASALTALHSAFPLEKQESKKKRKTYWSEIEVKTGDVAAAAALGAIGAAGAAKSARTDGSVSLYTEGETDVESQLGLTLDEAPAFTVGAVAPVEDFQAVLAFSEDPTLQATEAQRHALVKGAMQTLTEVVERHVTLGASSAYYKRALSCLQTLRAAAVQRGEFSLFNAFLRDRVKVPYQTGRHNAFWRLIVESNLSLISSREAAACGVTPAEADGFLHARVEEVAAAAPTPVTEEEEDLFGSMA